MMNTPELPMNILTPNLITRRSCLKSPNIGEFLQLIPAV